MAIEKMVEGRLRKYMEEVVFMEQKFVVNDSMTIKVNRLSNFIVIVMLIYFFPCIRPAVPKLISIINFKLIVGI